MFGSRRKKEAKALVLEGYTDIYEILHSFEIDPPEEKSSGFITKVKRFFEFAHAWTRKEVAAVARAVITAVASAAVGVIAAVAVGAVAVEAAIATVGAVTAVAVSATVVAAIVVSVEAVLGKADKKCNSIFFYIFLGECILITFAAPFINGLSILPPLIASLILLGSYFAGGIKGLVGGAKENEAVTKFPTNIQDLQKLVSLKAEAFVERHREKAMAADSELANRISELERSREKTKTLIIEAELIIESEDEEFIRPILQDLHGTLKIIQAGIDEMDVGKEEILKKLRIFKAHLPVFDRIYRRISIAEKAASFSDSAFRVREENCAFLKRELESLNEEGLVIARVIERVCLLSVGEAPVSQVIEEGESIGNASVKAVEALTA